MFDPYLMNTDDREALAQASRDIDGMVNALGLKNIDTNFSAIEKAHFDMLMDFKNKIIKQKTCTYLISEKLIKYDPAMAEQILTLVNDPIMRLFFANQESKYDSAFNLIKPYNLITFEKMPSNIVDLDKNYDPNKLDNAIFAMLFSRVQGIIDGFMKRFANQETIIIFDEYKVYKKTPGR